MIHIFKSDCHPQANGRTAQPGERQWVITIPLENGDDYLELQVGKNGRDALRRMFAQEEYDDAQEAKGQKSGVHQ